jgi:hypothetical protein
MDRYQPVARPVKVDRDRGLFTKRDRKFLLGRLDDELNENERYQKRYRLRKRVLDGLQDLRYLETMETRDIAQLADEVWPEDRSEMNVEQRRILDSIWTVLALVREIYGGERLQSMLVQEIKRAATLDHFEETGEYGRFDVDVTVTQADAMSVPDLIREGGDWSPEPGASEVLSLYNSQYHPDDFPEVELQEQSERIGTVADIYDELNEGWGVGRTSMIEALQEKEDFSERDAILALEEALYSGNWYETDVGILKRIERRDGGSADLI